jgi:biopolymer transport protein ExbD
MAPQEDADELITQINIVPLVDIILVVLIIFMLTASLIATQSIAVELPKAATGESTAPTTLGLTVTASGELYLNGAAISRAELAAQLPAWVRDDPATQAVIAADAAVAHGTVVGLIDLVRQGGITQFAINIDPTALPAAPGASPP